MTRKKSVKQIATDVQKAANASARAMSNFISEGSNNLPALVEGMEKLNLQHIEFVVDSYKISIDKIGKTKKRK